MKKAQQKISTVNKYPSILSSRDGWTDYLEMLRSDEPHLHQIEPTNHCPYTCMMCPRTEKMTRALGYMDMALYRKVIDEVDGFKEPVRSKEIELFHFGESLLHPQIDEMISYASGKNLKIVLSVNSPQLKPDLTDRILRANPFKIIISMDGYDDESYRKIRGKAANYKKAIDHIEYLLEANKKIPNTSQIIIRMIKFEINKDHTEAFREKWEEKGIKVEIRPFFPWSEKEMVELGEYEKNPPFMPCSFPFRYVVVQWNGEVVPCCRDYNAVNPMGNVRDRSLKEIWNGHEYKKLRDQLRTGEYGDNEYCRDCMSIYYTEE